MTVTQFDHRRNVLLALYKVGQLVVAPLVIRIDIEVIAFQDDKALFRVYELNVNSPFFSAYQSRETLPRHNQLRPEFDTRERSSNNTRGTCEQ